MSGTKAADDLKQGIAVKQSKESRTAAQSEAPDGLSASVQVLPLPAGLYLFSVKSAAPASTHVVGQLALPAMHIGLGPGVRSEQVEFIAGPSTHGAWLFTAGDLLVTKIIGTGVTMILTSVRAPGGEVLSISVERLDTRVDVQAPSPTMNQPAPTPLNGTAPTNRAAPVNGLAPVNGSGSAHDADGSFAGKSAFKPADAKLPLGVEIGAHVRTRGDMTFANVPWAGRVGPGLWIESFAIRPLEQLAAKDIEYKGLTGSGFETPWLSEGKMCGTKGMSTPLVGFAIRFKPTSATAGYDCEYSGYFQSGIVIGPLRNGAPCRSSVANDSLEGIQLRLVKRVNVAPAEMPRKAAQAGTKPGKRAADAATAAPAKKPAAGANRGADGVASPVRREPNRRP